MSVAAHIRRHRGARSLPRTGRALFLILWAIAAPLGQAAEPAAEYEIKAAFLYQFANFVVWPGALPSRSACIAVVGEDPFGQILERTVAGKTWDGRGILIRRVNELQEAASCRMVFISASESKRIRGVVERIAGAGVLTVGDTPGYCQAGVIINLLVENDRVRFEVNLRAAREAQLDISSKLLNVARQVFR
ncbi:MAG TPA: YfiR family protein [Bryobacteraceae bacterium]|nr:YfiR family protein [Bryobacteraceae bacterium]